MGDWLRFIRETKAHEQMHDSGMLDPQSGRVSECVTQFKQRDVRVLRDLFFEKTYMGCQFAEPLGRPCTAGSARPVV